MTTQIVVGLGEGRAARQRAGSRPPRLDIAGSTRIGCLSEEEKEDEGVNSSWTVMAWEAAGFDRETAVGRLARRIRGG